MNIQIQPLTTHVDLIHLSAEPNASVELDAAHQSDFIKTISTQLEKETAYILELKNVVYIDSFGLWAIFEIQAKIKQLNSELILLSPSPQIKAALDASKQSQHIPVLNSLEDAVQLSKKRLKKL